MSSHQPVLKCVIQASCHGQFATLHTSPLYEQKSMGTLKGNKFFPVLCILE